MRRLRLFAELTLYYAALALVVLAALELFPAIRGYMPVGSAEALIADPGAGLQDIANARTARVANFGESLGWLAMAIAGALLTALPVSRVYIAIRDRHAYDQSLVDTVILLPVIVTGIVVIVQNSLALAFSLAGIAAAVRFRNSLKSSGDALFILLAVGIGLSAGTGALELSLLMSVVFNYCFLLLWVSDYGEREGMKRYMADLDPVEPAPLATAAAPTAAEPPAAPTGSLPPP
jgi:hypothetical protein